MLRATHAARADFASAEDGFDPSPGASTLGLQYAALLAGVRIREALVRGDAAAAARDCLDGMALARDLTVAGGLVGRMVGTAIVDRLLQPCAGALTSLPPSARPAAVAALRGIRDAQPGLDALVREEAVWLQLMVYGPDLAPVRGWLRDPSHRQTGWLAALHDRRLGRALALLHRDPARPFTVEALAAEAGMSRSVFCERFRAAVGVPPLQYAARLRMQLAARMLGEPGASMAEVAERLGYGSEAAFGRAFKRHMGVAPGAARRRAQREPAPPRSPSLAELMGPAAAGRS